MMEEELQIAISMADALNRLQHAAETPFSDHSWYAMQNPRSAPTLSAEELELAKLKSMPKKLAWSRARADCRDFETVLRETQHAISVNLARLLADTVDPVLEGLREVVVVEEDEDVCGVCLEEMKRGDEARAMGCMHKFHGHCIFKWLKQKDVCPLCRYHIHNSKVDFED
ncbi:unnamed protein product [Ilex paraguariensis]|uniref:RING-type E3 ubiquitin transferase n=1 Tax=Ilex paraguariensis TaxID=185542 RepID=A0ABC8UTQ0_9AQUA